MQQNGLKKIAVRTIGCRLNQYESEKIAASLYPFGFERAEPDDTVDLYIINTCTVTHRADANCRNYIRRAVRENPQARIVVTGCYVDLDPDLAGGMEGVDLVVLNADKDRMSSILPERMPELFKGTAQSSQDALVTDFFDRNRAWLKISDGCNQRCTYCIVPRVRGPLTNVPVSDIIDEINLFVEHGYNEVVLTGVHMGHYRWPERHIDSFADLCRTILSDTDLYRLRLSSIEPQTIHDDMIELYANSNGRICRNWHVPLQSGSSRVLRKMARPYDRETYMSKVAALKDAVSNTIIGADVIVGFPGETEEDFAQSCELAESGLVDYLHVFSYSDRPGTPASKMTHKVSPQIIKDRVAQLSESSSRIRLASYRRQIGQVLEVISEHSPTDDGDYWAISDNYVRTRIPGTREYGKSIVRVRVTSAREEFVEGEVLETLN